MKQTFNYLLLAALISLSAPVQAGDHVDVSSVWADVFFYRPLGLAMTLSGTAIFAVISPMLAIADLNATDASAFADAKAKLITTPYDFTFNRPLGVLSPGRDGD